MQHWRCSLQLLTLSLNTLTQRLDPRLPATCMLSTRHFFPRTAVSTIIHQLAFLASLINLKKAVSLLQHQCVIQNNLQEYEFNNNNDRLHVIVEFEIHFILFSHNLYTNIKLKY